MSSVVRRQVRGRLSRERIVRTALEVADERGIDALTMRELGQLLGFEAMAIYRHVANKDAILEEILDLILSEVEITPASSDWADAIRGSASSLHHVLDAYIIGFSLWQEGHTLSASQREEVARRLASDVSLADYPRLLKHHDQHTTAGAHHDVSAFETGLGLLLDGLIEMRNGVDDAGSA